MNEKNEIQGIYDSCDLKKVFILFQNENFSAFSKVGQRETVNSLFDNFNKLLIDIFPDIFTTNIKKTLVLFKADILEITQFVYKHENKKQQYFGIRG